MPPSPAVSFDTEALRWFQMQLQSWGDRHRRDFPWRRTRDPYAIFAAECLLQKTDASTAEPLYQKFLMRYPDLETLAAAEAAELEPMLRPLGLHFRAARLVAAARAIRDRWGGRVPDDEAALLDLPGVGPYTARAVLANAFDRPAAVLDTNVARIVERFWGLQGGRVKSRDRLLWAAADAMAPQEHTGRWNLTLIDFGAAVCRARSPRCETCPLAERCRDWQRRSGDGAG